MYQFGGTIGASRYPKFRKITGAGRNTDDSKYSIFLRPFVKN